jgi:hypothetical protein
MRYRCNTQAMSATQSRDGSGRFPRGVSGNPGGRPKGLARAARELLGDDGTKIAEFWLNTMLDQEQPMRFRLEASRLLADRGWGKALMSTESVAGDNWYEGGRLTLSPFSATASAPPISNCRYATAEKGRRASPGLKVGRASTQRVVGHAASVAAEGP